MNAAPLAGRGRAAGARQTSGAPGARSDDVAHEDVSGGAHPSFEAFAASRGAALVRIARGLLQNPHDAEDVVQDVLVKAHVHWTTISSRENPDAYVRRMLVNASTSFWRRAARREFAGDVPDVAGADQAFLVDERDVVLAALRQLPPKQRAVLVLRHYEGMADGEIAQIMQVSVMTVRSNVHRGLANLRRLLEPPRPAPPSFTTMEGQS